MPIEPGEGKSAPDITVVLPVYNERGHIAQEIDRVRTALAESSYTFEILVIDDGSTDGSGEYLRGIEGIRLIRFAANRGTGTARRMGTRMARGKVVVWTDVDMSYPNDRIPWLVDQLDGEDHVVGARTAEKGTLKALRAPAKWIIRHIAGYLMQTKIPDLNSGFRAFRRDVALQFLHLLPAGFSCVSTLTMSFLASGYSVKYVPIEYSKRAGGSKFHWWSDTKRYLTQVIRMILFFEPLRVLGPLGVALGLIALAKLGYDWTTRDFRLSTNTLLIFFAAFQTLVIGFVADLVVRTGRPREMVPTANLTEIPYSPALGAEEAAEGKSQVS
ncbi:MAG: glycosyltransferase family 2 protein [Actinomycetota bacterium]